MPVVHASAFHMLEFTPFKVILHLLFIIQTHLNYLSQCRRADLNRSIEINKEILAKT